jgi:L-aspartate oxidase
MILDAVPADAAHAPDLLPQIPPPGPVATPDAQTDRWIEDLRENMWRYAGLLRDRQGLEMMLFRLDALAATMPRGLSRRAIEARNLHTVASIIVASALARHESRGAHYRLDYPEHDAAGKHSLMRNGQLCFERNFPEALPSAQLAGKTA